MKLKDLIGIIPDEEFVWINSESSFKFCAVPLVCWNQEVLCISEANWGGINIEICD